MTKKKFETTRNGKTSERKRQGFYYYTHKHSIYACKTYSFPLSLCIKKKLYSRNWRFCLRWKLD